MLTIINWHMCASYKQKKFMYIYIYFLYFISNFLLKCFYNLPNLFTSQLMTQNATFQLCHKLLTSTLVILHHRNLRGRYHSTCKRPFYAWVRRYISPHLPVYSTFCWAINLAQSPLNSLLHSNGDWTKKATSYATVKVNLLYK